MGQEQFLQQLRAVRDHGDQLQRRINGADDPLLGEVLAELGTALEELRVTEEQFRCGEIHVGMVLRDRERYRALFEQAPAAYLVTDGNGVVRQANLRATALLGVEREWLVGKPLASFVQLHERKSFRQRLRLPDELDRVEWELRLQPWHGDPLLVRALVSRLRDPDGGPTALAWLLRELPESANGLAGLLAATGQRSVGLGWPEWEALSAALQEVAESTVTLLGTDSAGLMLADAQGGLGWVTATDEPGRAFEQAQRDLQEGPCVMAVADNAVVATSDVRRDQRWLRLAAVAAAHGVRAVLAAPVAIDGRAAGTCNAICHTPRQWSAADVRALRAFASVLARLLAQAGEARQQAEMAAQLRQALDSRIAIEQAKGILMARLRIDEQVAFERMRQIARSSHRRVADVAREVVADRLHIGGAGPPAAARQGNAETS